MVVVAVLETLQGLLGTINNRLHNIIMVNIVAVILPRNDGMRGFHSTKVVATASQVWCPRFVGLWELTVKGQCLIKGLSATQTPRNSYLKLRYMD